MKQTNVEILAKRLIIVYARDILRIINGFTENKITLGNICQFKSITSFVFVKILYPQRENSNVVKLRGTEVRICLNASTAH